MSSWHLAPLLILRVRAKERARVELVTALATVRRADELVLARRVALRAGAAEPSRPVVGAELVVAALFQNRLRGALGHALVRAGEARAAVAAARQQHATARRDLEGLERERVRWLEARRRAREAAAERELDDLGTRARRIYSSDPSGPSGSTRPPEPDPVPQPLHELCVVERLANELVRAGLG